MEKDIKNLNKNNTTGENGVIWWEPAVRIFSQVSGWIVAPIVVALIVGKKLDNHFDTTPIIFLSLALFGFCISSFGIFKVISKYMKEIKKLGEEKNTEDFK